MSYIINSKTGEIEFGGFEKGIATSPHKGLANIQNANIATDQGEVMASYGRLQQSQPGTTSPTHTLNALDSTHLSTSFSLTSGVWISISASTITGLATGNYYIQNSNGTGSGGAASSLQLSAFYDGALTTGMGLTGTATYTLLRAVGSPVAYAIEPYFTTTQQYRYYVLDNAGLVWVYDSAKGYWFLPDTSITYFGSDTAPSGIAVLNGWLMAFSGNKIWVKPTVDLGGTTSVTTRWVAMTNVSLMSKSNTSNPHFALNGHQGAVYYTDGRYVGKIFPDTSLESGVANIQSYSKYTSSTTTGTLSTLINGSLPSTGADVGATGFSRIPAVFFTDQAGTQPTNLSANVVYYIQYSLSGETFEVYAALTGGAAINMATGAAGNQYFNTFFPVGTHAAYQGDHTLLTFTPQRLNLPYGEVSTCMAEVGNSVLVGTKGSIVYPWNQVDITPSSLISLPESNSQSILTVNQVAYIFAGNKGNIYITDGSLASLALKVPDYCAGVPGTTASYYEPTFTWGGSMYLRGRVYFSILDQTSAKAGNCGGVWSFYPSQNIAQNQDTGLALRLENQNSYASYNGVCTILMPYYDQNAVAPQYWAGWYSSTSSPLYGIDFTASGSVSAAIIETDLAPTGTILDKKTFMQVEYKLAAPLVGGETVTIKYRKDAISAWATAGTVVTESSTALSGYLTVNFEKTEWLQLQLTLNCLTSPSGSFIRLTKVFVR